MSRLMIEAEGLHKYFGETKALVGLDLDVQEGTILGVLGPNGAGKTTAVRILTTLTHPTKGKAPRGRVSMCSSIRTEVRASIGVAGQYAALDEILTGRENLTMIGRLYRLDRATVRQRADDLLEQLRADRCRRPHREDLLRRHASPARPGRGPDAAAAGRCSWTSRPPGSTRKGRLSMWDLIAGLATGGTTVLMTTQYLEEADRLADDIAGHRPRQGNRPRHRRRAEAPGRWRAPRGDDQRRAVPGRRAPRARGHGRGTGARQHRGPAG